MGIWTRADLVTGSDADHWARLGLTFEKLQLIYRIKNKWILIMNYWCCRFRFRRNWASCRWKSCPSSTSRTWSTSTASWTSRRAAIRWCRTKMAPVEQEDWLLSATAPTTESCAGPPPLRDPLPSCPVWSTSTASITTPGVSPPSLIPLHLKKKLFQISNFNFFFWLLKKFLKLK